MCWAACGFLQLQPAHLATPVHTYPHMVVTWYAVLLLLLLLLLLQAVLQFKWETFAGRMVTAEFCCFLAWLVAFSVFMLLFQVNTYAHWECWV